MKRAATASILLGSIAASNAQASVTVSPYRPEVGGRYVYFMVADTEAELDATAPPAGAFGWALDTSTLRCYTGSAWQDCATGGGGDGVGYDEVQDEGTPLTKRGKVNFIGSTVSCADNAGSSRTDCTFSGGAGLSDGDYGDVTVSGTGTVMTVDPDAVALGTDTTGNYVSSATASQGLTLTGTEGASLGLQSCTDGQILKNSSGTSWSCAADATGSGGAPYGEYDPDRPPSSVYLSDEFTGGESLTWTWGNQDNATATTQYDGLLLDGVDTAEVHVYGIDQTTHSMPTDSDQTWCVAMQITTDSTANTDGCGVGVLDGGTLASPTATTQFYWSTVGTDSVYMFDNDDFLPGGSTTIASKAMTNDAAVSSPWFWKLSYVDATRVLTASWSRNGRLWESFAATTTLDADPVTWFLTARQAGRCWVDYVRLFDSADADCGE